MSLSPCYYVVISLVWTRLCLRSFNSLKNSKENLQYYHGIPHDKIVGDHHTLADKVRQDVWKSNILNFRPPTRSDFVEACREASHTSRFPELIFVGNKKSALCRHKMGRCVTDLSIFSCKRSRWGNPPSWGGVTEFLEAHVTVTKPAKFQTKWLLTLNNLVSAFLQALSHEFQNFWG